MNTYTTLIRAIDPKDGELKEWCGPKISAATLEEARYICQQSGMGYCEVDGVQRVIEN